LVGVKGVELVVKIGPVAKVGVGVTVVEGEVKISVVSAVVEAGGDEHPVTAPIAKTQASNSLIYTDEK
jgi:hypothetical protein